MSKETIELKTSIQQMLELLTKHITEFKEFKTDMIEFKNHQITFNKNITEDIKDIKKDIQLMKNTPTMKQELKIYNN